VGTAIVLVGHYMSWARPENWITLLPMYAALGGVVLLANVIAGAATRTGRDIMSRVARSRHRR
jgi:hypothetical protein